MLNRLSHKTFEVKVGEEWVETHMECMEVGDTFRMRNAKGELIEDVGIKGSFEHVVVEMPFVMCDTYRLVFVCSNPQCRHKTVNTTPSMCPECSEKGQTWSLIPMGKERKSV